MNKAIEIGLYKELFDFYSGWLTDSKQNVNTKVIYYSNLIDNPSHVLNEVFTHFELSNTDQKVSLIKARYSQFKFYEKAINRIKKNIYNG